MFAGGGDLSIPFIFGFSLPEADDDFGGGMKVAQVPANDGRPYQTGEDGFALFVTRRRHDQMSHPGTDLKWHQSRNQSEKNNQNKPTKQHIVSSCMRPGGIVLLVWFSL